MTRTTRLSLGVALALLAGAAPVGATAAEADDPNTARIRIVNNFVSAVRVYAEDAEGRIHPLGRVARGRLKAFAVPDEVARLGDFRVRVYPSEPIGSWAMDEKGIKTQPLHLVGEASMTLWVEPNLSASTVEVGTG